MKLFTLFALFLAASAQASVSLPYSFSPSTTIKSSEMNADLTALMNEINTHESQKNGHFTALSDILAVNNSCGTYPINFNETQALGFRAENLSADPTPGNPGRLYMNTTTNVLMLDTGSADVAVAGVSTPNLTTVLAGGNSAGSYNIDMNENQLLHAKVETLASNPSAGNTGRLFYNTTAGSLELDNGSSIQALGGAQTLSQVLTTGNSAGSTNINFNGNQAVNMQWESLSSDPVSTNEGRIYYNSGLHEPKYYDGSAWQPLASSIALSAPIEFSVSGSPITKSGTLTLTKVSETQNTVWAAPNGSAGVPTFRALVAADIPTLNQNTTGSAGSFTGSLSGDVTGTQSATVVSSVGGSAASAVNVATVLVNGNQSGNKVLASPSNGTSGAPAFRALVSADVPPINLASTSNGGITGSLPLGNLAQGGAITNNAIVWNGTAWAAGSVGGGALVVTGSTASPQAITAAGGIAFSGGASRSMWFVAGSGGAVTVTATPQIAAATTVGQELIVVGTSDTNTVTLNDGNGLATNGPITLYNHYAAYFVWDGSVWFELPRR